MKKVNLVGIAAVPKFNKEKEEFSDLEYHVSVGSKEQGYRQNYTINDRFLIKPDEFAAFSKYFKDHKVSAAVPMQMIFPRFVKLPPVTGDNITKIVYYEAQQNVPFPMEEIAWGYKVRQESNGEMNVVLIAAKKDVVENIYDNLRTDAMLFPSDAIVSLYQQRIQNATGNIGLIISDTPSPSTTVIIADMQGTKFTRSIPLPAYFDNDTDLAIMKNKYASQELIEAGDKTAFLEKANKNVGTRLNAELNRTRNFIRSQIGYDFNGIWTADARFIANVPKMGGYAIETKDPYAEILDLAPSLNANSPGAIMSAGAMVAYQDGLKLSITGKGK